MRRTLYLLVISLCCAVGWLAAADLLDVKTGLWQTTTNSNTTGRPPIPPDVLAKLTPEQRAQLEERMKANPSLGGAKTTTSKTCITKEDLSKPLTFGADVQSCTRKIVSSTPTRQEIQIDCARQGMKQTGTLRIEATSPESIQGSVEFTMSGNGNTMNHKSTFSGKWLGADCGSLGK